MDYGKRYDAKRASGISELRSDGSRTSRETDVQAGDAEKFAAELFGVLPNDEIYTNHGDKGIDFIINGVTFDVVHLGLKDGKARRDGNLLINPHEPHRHAEVYVVVRGTTEEGFDIVGWYPHSELIKRPQRDFGYGMRYNCPINELRQISEFGI